MLLDIATGIYWQFIVVRRGFNLTLRGLHTLNRPYRHESVPHYSRRLYKTTVLVCKGNEEGRIYSN